MNSMQVKSFAGMKHLEFYTKYKVSYPPLTNSFFSKGNWWRIGLITAMAALIEPLIMYKRIGAVPFSFRSYILLAEYFLILIVPFVAFLLWINWRESVKRKRGYGWVGKFNVIDKQSALTFFYLFLEPGINNKLKVNRALFEKISVGDSVLIRRDSLGSIEEISKVDTFSSRIARVRRTGNK
jgi:hypothetical protein